MTKLGAVVVAMFGAIVIGGFVVVSQFQTHRALKSASGTQSALRKQKVRDAGEIGLGVFGSPSIHQQRSMLTPAHCM